MPTRTLEALRYAARCAFTLAHVPTTVDDLAAQPEFAGVGRGRMRRWADEDGWEFARHQASEAWRRKAQAKVGQGLLRRHDRQMAMLAHLHDEAARLRCQQAVQPRSWESVANVQLKTAQLMHQWSKDHAAAVAKLAAPESAAMAGGGDGGGTSAFDTATLPDMSDDEAQIGAHAILRRRMEKRLSPDSESVQDDSQPEATAANTVPLRKAVGG